MIKRNKLNDSKTMYVFYWVIAVLLIFYCLTILYPFIWNFFVSFMERKEYYEKYSNILSLPASFSLKNYAEVLKYSVSTGGIKSYTFLEMAWNTIWLSLVLGALSMVLPVCASYCCAKYKFFGSNFFFYYGIVFCAIPLMGGTSTTFKILYALNIYDTYLARFYLTITGSSFGNFLFLFAFFKGLSWSLAESAFIDGASDFQVFIHIMLPQVLPVLLTFYVTGFIGQWNDWMSSYLFTPSIPMVAYGVQKMVKIAGFGDNRISVPMSYAALFLTMIVPLGLFAIFSNRILNTVYTGGLKG